MLWSRGQGGSGIEKDGSINTLIEGSPALRVGVQTP